jgi:hypothetical protein
LPEEERRPLSPPARHAPGARNPEGFIPLPDLLKRQIKDAIVALTMGYWCFVRSWTHLLFDGNRFFNQQPVLPVELWALTVNILVAALLIWLGIGVWRRCPAGLPSFVLDLLFLLLLVFPADFIRAKILLITDAQLAGFLKQPLVALCPAAVLILVLWKHRTVARFVAMIIVVTFPMVLLTMAKIILISCNLMSVNECPSSLPPPPLLPVLEGQPRVVWIIFDETDYRLAFEQRPAGLAMPEFDRLRQTALSADHAYAPADFTEGSMPALIAGRRLAGISHDGCNLALKLNATNDSVDWTALPSVFSQARASGVNTALVGWFIPYARLLGGSLNYCSWYPMQDYQSVDATTFGESMQRQLACLAWPIYQRQIFINMCQGSLKDALSVAVNPTYGMILLHLPPPHYPGIYLPEKKEFTCMGIPRPASYFNNLALADHELGALRQAMEKTGQWDKTWVILSADHSWRQSQSYDGKRDYRVPFLVKPAGASQSMTYSNQFNTVLTRDLILAILHHQLSDQASVAEWLNTRISPDLPVMPAEYSFE